MDTKRLFMYLMNQYIQYYHYWYCQLNKDIQIFDKYFVQNNAAVQIYDNTVTVHIN